METKHSNRNGASVSINGTNCNNSRFNSWQIRKIYHKWSFGNITVKSTKQVYVSYFGTNGAATYGGYYSGFDTKPEIN
jgi:hypothetical protein